MLPSKALIVTIARAVIPFISWTGKENEHQAKFLSHGRPDELLAVRVYSLGTGVYGTGWQGVQLSAMAE